MAQSFGQRMAAIRAAKKIVAGTTGKTVKTPKPQNLQSNRLKATTADKSTQKAGKAVKRGKASGKPVTKKSTVRRTVKK